MHHNSIAEHESQLAKLDVDFRNITRSEKYMSERLKGLQKEASECNDGNGHSLIIPAR